MSTPAISQDPMYQLLRTEDIKAFNQQRDGADLSHLKGGDYRGLDLRGLNAEGLDFSGAYFRNTDLRGIDFRQTILDGASCRDAKISGCYFPKGISAAELRMSMDYGTRIRNRG